MKRKTLTLIALIIMLSNQATGQPPLDPYLWKNRIVLIQTTNLDSSAYREQKQNYLMELAGLNDRALLVLGLEIGSHRMESWTTDVVFTKEQVRALLADYFTASQNEQVLIGKDGGVKLRGNRPITTGELFSTIDQMPMRRAEMRKKRSEEK